MKKLFIYLFIFALLISSTYALVDLGNDTGYKPSQSYYMYVTNKTVLGLEDGKTGINETCFFVNTTLIFCNDTTNVDWLYVIDLTPTIPIPTPSGGGGTSHSTGNKCDYIFNAESLTFSYFNMKNTIVIYNNNSFYHNIIIDNITAPTVYGKSEVIISNISSFKLNSNESKTVSFSLTNVNFIKNDILLNITIKNSIGCKKTIPTLIKKMPSFLGMTLVGEPTSPIFYDLRITTDKLIYAPQSLAKLYITIENKANTPDTDTMLKLYILKPQNNTQNQTFINKEYILEEILYSVPPGITALDRNYTIPGALGRYVIGAEYETANQGLLTAESTFFVAPVEANAIYLLILVIIVTVLILLFVFLKKRPREPSLTTM